MLLLLAASIPTLVSLPEYAVDFLAPNRTAQTFGQHPVVATVITLLLLVVLTLGYFYARTEAGFQTGLASIIFGMVFIDLGIETWNNISPVCNDTTSVSGFCMPAPDFLSTYPVAIGYLLGGSGLLLAGSILYSREFRHLWGN
ncbi:MAG: hypothetical protein ABEJ55_07515 [Halanaeroarchaeum sp.]